MGWCLNCHRHPENNLRPVSQVFNLDWKPGTGQSQEQIGLDLKEQWKNDNGGRPLTKPAGYLSQPRPQEQDPTDDLSGERGQAPRRGHLVR